MSYAPRWCKEIRQAIWLASPPDPSLARTTSPDASELLLRALVAPTSLQQFNDAEWDLLLQVARAEGLLARIAVQSRELGFYNSLSPHVRDLLAADRIVAADHERMVHWELNRLERALRSFDAPIVLLKGAAYFAFRLPPGRGRFVADVDILVPRERLADVETALLADGWEPTVRNEYDQQYYRRWMHELPPLRHRSRMTVIDVHHNILPQTSRLRPDSTKLIAAAVAGSDFRFRRLADVDMVLHSAAHLFHDGDLHHGLRDVVDLHDLLTHFGRKQAFWQRLVPRAQELDLTRPLFYALRYTREFLATPVPKPLPGLQQLSGPPRPIVLVMDQLVSRVIRPQHPDQGDRLRPIAAWLLYARSHWLRMPLRLLAPHLVKKALRGKRLRSVNPQSTAEQ